MAEAAKIMLADPKTGFGVFKGHLPDRGGTMEIRVAPARNADQAPPGQAPPGLE
jgi:hypothetical protein